MKKKAYFSTVKNPLLLFYLLVLEKIGFFFKKTENLKKNKPPKRLLLIQLAHLGDVILSTSILPLIKQKYPGVKIDLLIASASFSLIKDHPLIHQIYCLDHPKLNRKKRSFLKIPAYLFQCRKVSKHLKRNAYDISIDLSGFYPNSHFLTYFLKIPKRIGYLSGGFGNLLTDPFFFDLNKDHITLKYAKLLAAIDIHAPNNAFLTPHLPFTKKQKKEKPYVVFHPFSGDRKKDWEIKKWKELLTLFAQTKYEVIFTGKSAKERRKINEIITNINAKNLAGKISIDDLKEIVANADLVISVDTMASHLAAAFLVPTLVVFSNASDPNIWRPASVNSHCVSSNISEKEVFSEANKLLQLRRS